MSVFISTLNAFIEDTAVIVLIAYLLARGRVLALLRKKRRTRFETAFLSIVFGLIGLTEAVFPGARYPYVTHTLIVTFAALECGAAVGIATAAVTAAGALFIESRGAFLVPHAGYPPYPAADTAFLASRNAVAVILGIAASVLAGLLVRALISERWRIPGSLAAGMLAQAGATSIRVALSHSGAPAGLPHAWVSVPANGIGVMLLQVVVSDARVRAESERHRIEAERARVVAAEAELTALRARVHPHFLYNTLTSIAALCSIASDKAEEAITRLGQLMRRALENDVRQPVCLADELEYTRGYVEIEQYRLADRLAVTWEIDAAALDAECPAFAVQTLVENAVIHGVAPKVGQGKVLVKVHRTGSRAIIAICDNGAGMSPQTLVTARATPAGRPRGIQIVNQQLIALSGSASRLRVFSRKDAGTLACFSVPLAPAAAHPKGATVQ